MRKKILVTEAGANRIGVRPGNATAEISRAWHDNYEFYLADEIVMDVPFVGDLRFLSGPWVDGTIPEDAGWTAVDPLE